MNKRDRPVIVIAALVPIVGAGVANLIYFPWQEWVLAADPGEANPTCPHCGICSWHPAPLQSWGCQVTLTAQDPLPTRFLVD